jgi:hypothetical protein
VGLQLYSDAGRRAGVNGNYTLIGKPYRFLILGSMEGNASLFEIRGTGDVTLAASVSK